MTKKDWFKRNAIGEDGLTWIVFGEDTFAIKDELKELGCKFNPVLKWHSAEPVDVPCGYGQFSVSFDDLYEWDPKYGTAYPKETAKNIIDARIAELKGPAEPSLSEYYGEVGERFRGIPATYIKSRSFDTQYGWTVLHTFQIGENVLNWFTQKELDFAEGQAILLSGTVKKHEEYRGVKTTQLSRCIVKEA